MNLAAYQGAVELGIIYAIMALGVFISFRTLNMPDLTVDGSFVLGVAISAVLCTNEHPIISLGVAFIGGCIAGSVTAILHTKLKIQAILSGILVMLGLYSINLRVMGNKASIPLNNKSTVFKLIEANINNDFANLLLITSILIFITSILYLFLKTKLGFALRATGDNDNMVRALGINTDMTKIIGLSISNGLVALSGAIIAQYQSFADIGMGTGMVIIGLASVIIGEVIFGTKSLMRKLIAVILGSILYRLIIAKALNIGMPPTDLKLISAIIVTLALSIPVLKEKFQSFKKRYLTS